jgi:hypothetical protein
VKRPVRLALSFVAAVLAVALVAVAASGSNGSSNTVPNSSASPSSNGHFTIAAAGDIACDKIPPKPDKQAVDRRTQRGYCQYNKVAKLLGRGNYDRFLPLGDIQYLLAKPDAFRTYYDKYFGPYKHITSPVPGNHETYTPYMRGYRDYFKARAHSPLTYYSYNLGGWHFVAINSMLCRDHTWSTNHGVTPLKANSHFKTGCRPGDPMYEWIKRDLAAHDNQCTLAYFHHPAYFWANFGGGPDSMIHPGYSFTRPMYRLLYADKVDVVLSGHMHFYERLKPLNPAGESDPKNGFTQFIVGTGGDTKEALPSKPLNPLVAAAQNKAFGLLSMTLNPDSADFAFVSAPGQPDYKDSGTIQCH